jgi:hypothetical protein
LEKPRGVSASGMLSRSAPIFTVEHSPLPATPGLLSLETGSEMGPAGCCHWTLFKESFKVRAEHLTLEGRTRDNSSYLSLSQVAKAFERGHRSNPMSAAWDVEIEYPH